MNLKKIMDCGLVAVVRAESSEQAFKIAEACIAGGVAAIEITFTIPGETFGPGFIKAIKGPLPQAPLMPTGGVGLDNVGEWIKAGCVAVGVGGNLTGGAKKGDYESITTIAKQFIEKIHEARGK